MNREIKFRAWIDNEMVSHEKLIDMDQETHAVYTIITNEEKDNRLVFMQFTGMTDKFENPQEIWEGDIILEPISGKYFTVDYDDYGGGFLFCEVGKDDGVDFYEFEDYSSNWFVCGNIFENPNLLEVPV